MKRKGKRILLVLLCVVLIWTGMLIFDRQTLRRELLRLHVVGASDDPADQNIKLRVRDAILESLQEGIEDAADVEAAVAYITDHLAQMETIANQVLENEGYADRVKISLDFENFPKRIYDTFSLPAGIYRSLRVIIGEGGGQNWWCVVFPQLCLPETAEAFAEEAEECGISSPLCAALAGKPGYEVRFFLLDLLGKAENYLCRLK